MINLEEGDLVLCTVDRIVGTVVFVKIEEYNDLEGSIIVSEIAPGRIRNLRDYVVPKKKIVCKVLRISGDRIDLSLRRVSKKEQKEVLEKAKLEKSYESILKTILEDKSQKIIEEIKQNSTLVEFIEEVKSNPKELERWVGKESADKLLNILKTQKQKTYIIRKSIILKTIKPDGALLIKEIFSKTKDVEVNYISAGKYLLKSASAYPKKAENILKENIQEIEKNAKNLGLEFNVKEK